MKRNSSLFLASSLLLPTVLASCGLAADPVVSKMQALFGQFDADHNNALSPAEQRTALAAVNKSYGEQWAKQVQQMFTRAAAKDKSVSAASWRDQVAEYARKPEEPAPQTVMIAMRDGKRLATDIYLPPGEGPFPVVLTRTPYGRKSRKGADEFTNNRMVFIAQDMRGRFDSEGENLPFVGCGWDTFQDGVDTIAWIRKQTWCDGGVGTVGGSAGGITQNLLAGAVPEGLRAQYISVAAANMYADATYLGGAFRRADAEQWIKENKFDPRALDIIRAHPSYDDYWRKFDTSLKFAEMNVPAVHVGGWFDMFAQATIDEFVGRQHLGAAGARGAQKLIMGPWTHAVGKMPAGELDFPGSKPPAQYNSRRWFEHYLRGEDNGVDREPAVAYYVMGDVKTPGAPGNQWRQADDWPVPATETAYYFTRDRKLGIGPAADAEAAPIEFTFDPADPCPTIGGGNLTIDRGPFNQNRIESRADVIVFDTAPLEAPVEVTGRVRARVFVSSTAADTDLSVRLCDVYPDGKSYLIADGVLRLRYRRSLERPEPLMPGNVEEVTVDCWSTSIIFNAGHRIRATVTSSNFPRVDVNPGTGEPWSESGEKRKQTNRIYCDAQRPSCVLLPIVTARDDDGSVTKRPD